MKDCFFVSEGHFLSVALTLFLIQKFCTWIHMIFSKSAIYTLTTIFIRQKWNVDKNWNVNGRLLLAGIILLYLFNIEIIKKEIREFKVTKHLRDWKLCLKHKYFNQVIKVLLSFALHVHQFKLNFGTSLI